MNGSDDDLRARFSALRSHDAATAPPFDQVADPAAVARRRGASRRRRRVVELWLPAAAVLATVTVRAWIVRPVPEPADGVIGIDLGSVYWRAPSDFLLETPGQRLLRDVPTLVPPIHVPGPVPGQQPESAAADRRPES
jgi:hypothetical protein